MGLHVFLQKIKLKNTFVKLVLSYILITIMIISVLSIILYKLFFETSLDVIEADSKGRLSQNINHIGLIRSRVVSLGLQLLKDSDVIRAIYSEELLTTIEQAGVSRKLYNIIESDSVIHSIFLYNARTREINETFGLEVKEAISGRMLNLLREYDVYGSVQFFPSKINYKKVNGDNVSKNIITAIFSNSAYYREDASLDASRFPAASAVVINLNADSIQDSIASTSEGQKSEAIIIDKEGNIVFDSVTDNFAGNLANMAYIKDILGSEKQEGIFTKDINGEKSLIVFKATKVPEWVFINVYSYNNLFSKINDLGRAIISICISMLLAALIIAVLATRRISTPFQRFLNKVRDESSADNDESIDQKGSLSDVQYLIQTFNQIKQKTLKLESSVSENIPMVKKALLKQMVRGERNVFYDSARRYDELFGDMFNADGEGSFLVIVFSIDGDMELKSKGNLDNDMSMSLEALIVKMLSSHFQSEPIDYENNCLYFLIKNNDNGFISSQIRSILVKIHEELQQTLKLKISCSVGMPVKLAEDLHFSYSNADDLIKYRLVYGYGAFFCYDMEELASRASFVSIGKKKEKLLQSIKLCDQEGVKTEIGGIIQEISQCQYDYIMLTLNQLMLDIMEAVQVFFGSDTDKLNFNNIYSNMNKIGTLDEMKEFLILYCNAAIDKIEKKRLNRKNDMFQEIIAYINSHYHEYDISTDSLAGMANLTPGYFGKLFTEDTGKSVNEYIMDIRLLKGKELLKTTDMTIYDISSKVGFNNSTYFTTLFKKSFNVTPNQYRTNSRMEIKNS